MPAVVAGVALKVLFWNVFEGMGGPNDERLVTVKNIIRGFDVVAFSELNGWDEFQFGAYFEDDFPHSAFLTTNTGYHLGALSKEPIRKPTALKSQPMHHGLLLFETFQTVFCATHLNPRSSMIRADEVQFLTTLINERMRMTPEKNAVIMGDLNTLSPADTFTNAAVECLKKGARTRRKFFRSAPPLPPSSSNPLCSSSIRQGESKELDFEPFRLFERAGFFDLGIPDDTTVPTPVNTDVMHATSLRLDFFLGNRKAQAASLSSACSIKDDVTSTLSDHYPILMEFDRRKILEGDHAKTEL